MKAVTEAAQSSSRSAVVAKRRVIQQFDGGIRHHPAVTPQAGQHSTGNHSAATARAANDGAAYAGTANGGAACTGAFYDSSTYATTLVYTSPFLPTQGDLQILL